MSQKKSKTLELFFLKMLSKQSAKVATACRCLPRCPPLSPGAIHTQELAPAVAGRHQPLLAKDPILATSALETTSWARKPENKIFFYYILEKVS